MEWFLPEAARPYHNWFEAAVALGLGALAAIVLRILVGVLYARPVTNGVPFAVASRGPVLSLLVGGVLLSSADAAVRQFESVHAATVAAVERVLTVVWIGLLAYAVHWFTKSRLESARRDAKDSAHIDRLALSQKLVSGFAFSVGMLLAMRASGLDVTPLLAGGAVGGVIIGLALQESLSNVFSGLMINLDSSIGLGDTVRLPTGEEGLIESVGWRTTGIRQWDGSLLVVPNNQLSKQMVINLTRNQMLYVLDVQGRIPFGADLSRAESLLGTAAARVQAEYSGQHELARPVIRWREMVDGHMVFKIFVEIGNAHDQYRARSALMKSIYEAMVGGGILVAVSTPKPAPAPAPEE
ncbi:MAG: mechanosensitive ion channel family protein [Armatimonadetes bacterium]|nr:mechanosensitive ion channel family protein [Armatimonadota bacterium]